MISLSSIHKMSMAEISEACAVTISTVPNTFNRFEQGGFGALLDKNMAHKQSSLAAYEEAVICNAVHHHPQSLPEVLADLSAQGIDTNKSILKRYLKSLKNKRDETLYHFFKQALQELETLEKEGEMDLFYSDEVGFQLAPQAVYAWLEKDSQASLPAQKGTLLNILGLINRQNEAEF